MDISKLKELDACVEATDWCEKNNITTIEEAWDKCERGDWMLWLYRKLYPNRLRNLTLAKGHCANTVRHLMTDPRSINAVDAAIAFGEGKISKVELRAAAYTAASGAYTAADAAVGAYTAAAAAYTAADAADGAYAAAAAAAAYTAAAAADGAYAAAAAAAAAYTAAAAAAKKLNQKLTANICRQHLTLKESE
jgi:hypothetical protein